jgi:hypothetical protein
MKTIPHRLIRHPALASLASLALASSVWAGPLTITNPGFEDPVLGDGAASPAASWTSGYYSSPATAWSAFAGLGGAINPDAAYGFGGTAFAGDNTAWVKAENLYDQGVSQILGSVLSAGSVYNLSGRVGNPGTKNTSMTTGNYRIELVANNVILASSAAALPAADTWLEATLSYDYDAAPQPTALGSPLEIRLFAVDNGQTGWEVTFDEVSLTSPVPDPIANTGGPYNVAIPSGTLSLDGSASLPSDGATISLYEWDIDNDGIYDITGSTPATITYSDLTTTYGMIAGPNTIKLRVTDTATKTATTTTTVTLAIPSTTLNTGNWQGGVWTNGQPNGAGLDAIIAGSAAANGIVTAWSGDLYVNSGVTLTVTGNTADFIALSGAANIYLNGTIVNNWKTRTLTSNIIVSGGGQLVANNNSANNQDQQFSGVISGTGGFSVSGRNHEGLTFTNTNTFTGGFTAQTQNQRYGIGFGTGSAGAGNVTILGTAGSQSAVVRVLGNNPFATTATLSLNGSGWASTTGGFGPYSFYGGTSYNIDMNGKTATVDKLFVNGVQQPAGDYHGGDATWIGDRVGGGTLTVTTGPVDTTLPTLVGSGFVDDKSGGPITEVDPVIYTVTFSEAMKVSTIGIADFENAGTPAATINSVTPTGDPAVFNVSVYPGGPGTLQLQVKAGAVLEDTAGNALVTTTAIHDDTIITVDPEPAPTLDSITDNFGGAPIFLGQSVTYALTFSRAMNGTSIDTSDFENASATAITVDSVSATFDPTVFLVTATPTAIGTIQLQVKAGASLEDDTTGKFLVTTTAIPDDTTITVQAGSPPATETITVDDASAILLNMATLTISSSYDASASDKLVVILATESGNDTTVQDITGVQYNGTPLTRAVQSNGATGPLSGTATAIFYLDSPGSAGAITWTKSVGGASTSGTGRATIYALSNTAPGVGAVGSSSVAGGFVNTSVGGSLVIAGLGDGGQNAIGNFATLGTPDAPLTQTHSAVWGANDWGSFASGHGFVATPTVVPASFTHAGDVRLKAVAAAFQPALVVVGTPYGNWTGGPFASTLTDPTANVDFDNGGLATGIEWVVGGDPTDGSDDAGLAPTLDNTTDPDFFIFTYRRSQAANADANTTIVVEYGSALSDWAPATAGADIIITPTPDVSPGIDSVQVKIRRTLAVGGKLFARLNVVIAP